MPITVRMQVPTEAATRSVGPNAPRIPLTIQGVVGGDHGSAGAMFGFTAQVVGVTAVDASHGVSARVGVV